MALTTAEVPSAHRFTVAEIAALTASGALDERAELLDGVIYDHMTSSPDHADYVDELAHRLTHSEQLPEDTRVRQEKPVVLNDTSAPEPDIALVDASRPRGRHPQPHDVQIIVEVADSSLNYDTGRKADLYRSNGIRAYVVVDLTKRSVIEPAGFDAAPRWVVAIARDVFEILDQDAH